jgi:hypothetical protein
MKLAPGARRRTRTVFLVGSSRPPQQRLKNTAVSLLILLTAINNLKVR